MSENLASAEARQAAERRMKELAECFTVAEKFPGAFNGWLKAHDDALADSYVAVVRQLEEARAELNDIRGVVGFPGTDELNKFGLSESLPDIVRCTHRRWLEGTHASQQSALKEQARADRAERLNRELVEASRRVLEFAKDKNHVCYVEDNCGRCDAIEQAEVAIKSAKQGEAEHEG